jgi:FkbM family methyltransferase
VPADAIIEVAAPSFSRRENNRFLKDVRWRDPPAATYRPAVPVRDAVASGLAALGRRYPLCRGHGWLARHAFPDPPGHADAVEVALRSGPRILVHPDEFIGRIVFYFGELDPRISWICHRILRPGDAVVDVGANYGVVSLVAAALVGPRGVVHAFEPQPHLAALLRRSSERNGFAQLHLHELALSEADAELQLRIPDGNLGGASLSRVVGPGSSISVAVRHSGTVLAELDLSAIRMLKVDIEGHEAEFLRGGREHLRACPPDVIVFESNEALYEDGRHLPFWQREAVREIRNLGYVIVRISQRLGAVGPKLVRVQPGGDDSGFDFVAVHRSRYDEIAGLLAIS